jgi:hypothetical protein
MLYQLYWLVLDDYDYSQRIEELVVGNSPQTFLARTKPGHPGSCQALYSIITTITSVSICTITKIMSCYKTMVKIMPSRA